MIKENLSILKINKLTQKQYDRELTAGNIDETALYLTPKKDDNIKPTTISQADYTALGTAVNTNGIFYLVK